jgi:hypothetical protein
MERIVQPIKTAEKKTSPQRRCFAQGHNLIVLYPGLFTLYTTQLDGFLNQTLCEGHIVPKSPDLRRVLGFNLEPERNQVAHLVKLNIRQTHRAIKSMPVL